jgi:hypothetical protein
MDNVVPYIVMEMMRVERKINPKPEPTLEDRMRAKKKAEARRAEKERQAHNEKILKKMKAVK